MERGEFKVAEKPRTINFGYFRNWSIAHLDNPNPILWNSFSCAVVYMGVFIISDPQRDIVFHIFT